MDDNTKDSNKHNRMRNKKAMQVTLKDMILILVVAIILIFFARNVTEKLTGQSDKDICRLSVLAKAEGKIVGFEGTSQLDCHTNYIDIKEKGIYMSNHKVEDDLQVKFKELSDTQKEEKIKTYLANQLYDCWYQFGQGKVDFLSNYDFGTNNIRCFPCASINFDKSALQGMTYDDWEAYLTTTNTQSGSSYKNYLTNGEDVDFYSDAYQEKLIDSNKGQQMSIYFVAAKQGALSFVLGYSPVFGSASYLVDPDSLVDKCDYMY